MLGAVLVIGTIAGCGRAPHGAPADGYVGRGTYTNSFFAFSLAFPPGWAESTQTIAEQARQQQANTLAAAANNPEFQREFAAAGTSHHLLVISEKSWGVAAESNPSIIIAAENISRDRELRSGEDYIVKVSRLLANSPLPYQPSGEIREVKIGGVTFSRLDFAANIGGKSLRQIHLARVVLGYALTFILSAGDESELKRLEAILGSVRFE